MSKSEQARKIQLVRKQLNDLEERHCQLTSCLRTLIENPDVYFNQLHPEQKEYKEYVGRIHKQEHVQENKPSSSIKEDDHATPTERTGRASNFGFISSLFGSFHSAATSVSTWGDSRLSSSSSGHTAPGYYSSYSRTSGGSVSFPSLGGLFSSIPQSQSVHSAASNTSLSTPSNPPPQPVPAPRTHTYRPTHYTGCPCLDCVRENC